MLRRPKTKLEEMYNTAYGAFDAGKFPEALKQLDAIDARQPDLAASKNLRGVILMRQGNYDQAEAALTEAARIDPKFWNARFNMAEIPFLKKDWAEARNLRAIALHRSIRFGKGSFAADPIQDLADLSNGGQKQHGRFHSGQARAFARYTGC